MATKIFDAFNEKKLGEMSYTPTDPSELLRRLREGNWLPSDSKGTFTATPVDSGKIYIVDRKTGIIAFTIRTK